MAHILLTGFKGCGKSTVGKKAAERLNRPFIDLDRVLEKIYAQAESPLSFREIFQKVGEAEFRQWERLAARKAAQKARESAAAGGAVVIALGGGSLLDSEIAEILRPLGLVIYLDVPFPQILERVRRDGFPAWCNTDNPEEDLRRRFEERQSQYREVADLIVEASDLDPGAAARALLECLESEKEGSA